MLTLFLFLSLSHEHGSTLLYEYYALAQNRIPRFEVVKNVKTTAYITPVPTQKNYEELVRYNGKEEITATGSVPQTPNTKRCGTIAAGPDVPYGTLFFIPGYGFGVVDDRGGKVDNKSLDLYFGKGKKAYVQAMRWGVQNKNVVRITWATEKGSI